MWMKILSYICAVLPTVLLAILLLTACGRGETPEPTPGPTPTPTPAPVLLPEAVESDEPEPTPEPAPVVVYETQEAVDWVGKDIFAEIVPEDERHRQWLSDLRQFRNQLFIFHPKFYYPELAVLARNIDMGYAFDAALVKLAGDVPGLTDFEAKMEMQRALVVFEDAHMVFGAGGAGDAGFITALQYNRYPLAFQWMYDGFYLLQAHRDFAEALNLRLTAVGGMNVEKAFALFKGFWPTENIYNARDTFTSSFLMLPDVLNALGVISGQDTVFSFAASEGETVDIHVTADYIFIDEFWWRGDWVNSGDIICARVPGDLPLTFRYPEISNWYVLLEDYHLLYIRIHSFWSHDPDFARTFNRTTETIRNYNIQRVVIDARGNGGGNHNPYVPRFQSIANNLPEGGGLYYLIDLGTFSAAALGAGEMYSLGATLIGSPAGQLTEFYAFRTAPGLRDFRTRLSYSGYNFGPPNIFHTLSDFGINPPDLILRPHVHIEPTIDDWVNNHDPVMAYILR